MNVYDFDGTIRRGDTSVDFFLFEARRYPSLFLCIPKIIFCALRMKTGHKSLVEFKEDFFSFLKKIKDIDRETELFCEKNAGCIDKWYLEKSRADDIVITASPEFLVTALCRGLDGVTVMGTIMDKKSGKITGKNCKGEEKVERFRERYGDAVIDEFYSDSQSDLPLARIARSAFIVEKDGVTITKWILN